MSPPFGDTRDCWLLWKYGIQHSNWNMITSWTFYHSFRGWKKWLGYWLKEMPLCTCRFLFCTHYNAQQKVLTSFSASLIKCKYIQFSFLAVESCTHLFYLSFVIFSTTCFFCDKKKKQTRSSSVRRSHYYYQTYTHDCFYCNMFLGSSRQVARYKFCNNHAMCLYDIYHYLVGRLYSCLLVGYFTIDLWRRITLLQLLTRDGDDVLIVMTTPYDKWEFMKRMSWQ